MRTAKKNKAAEKKIKAAKMAKMAKAAEKTMFAKRSY